MSRMHIRLRVAEASASGNTGEDFHSDQGRRQLRPGQQQRRFILLLNIHLSGRKP